MRKNIKNKVLKFGLAGSMAASGLAGLVGCSDAQLKEMGRGMDNFSRVMIGSGLAADTAAANEAVRGNYSNAQHLSNIGNASRLLYNNENTLKAAEIGKTEVNVYGSSQPLANTNNQVANRPAYKILSEEERLEMLASNIKVIRANGGLITHRYTLKFPDEIEFEDVGLELPPTANGTISFVLPREERLLDYLELDNYLRLRIENPDNGKAGYLALVDLRGGLLRLNSFGLYINDLVPLGSEEVHYGVNFKIEEIMQKLGTSKEYDIRVNVVKRPYDNDLEYPAIHEGKLKIKSYLDD